MAEVVLSPLVEVVIGGLASAIIEEAGLICGVDEELDNLKSRLSHVRGLLADAEERRVMDGAVKHWLAELESVAYDADDVVDEFAYKALERKAEAQFQTRNNQVCNVLISCYCFKKQAPFRRNMAHKIKEINKHIARISQNGEMNLHLRVVAGERRIPFIEPPLSSSLMPKDTESDVVGRENDVEQIVNLLVSTGTDTTCGGKDVSVISIVGMGGLGKTTLAQLVYNNETVEKHFEVRAWVCVSENLDVVLLTKAIIESATREICDLSAIDALQRKLKDIMSAKRFLLALDDVWNMNRGAWDRLRPPFSFGAEGSKIMVTTRDKAVAEAMDTEVPYNLAFLSNDHCWLLFKRRAFGRGNADEFPELLKIGMELVERRCQGLPLAAKSLGALLSSKRDERSWNSVLNSQIWSSSESEVMKALRVSYHHLPPYIKQCFAYCSIFPKDYEFNKDRLVRLWMAQGFIIPKDGMTTLEDIGNEYFDFLLSRSFFQFQEEYDGLKYYYKMHDCVHDLALSVSSGEHQRMEKESIGSTDLCEFKRLRTFILEGDSSQEFDNRVIHDLTVKYTCLRVLILNSAPIKELPDSISNLIHLRYLGLFKTMIRQLPESVCRLYHLQTLDLTRTEELRQLPRDLGKLVNLRHLCLHMDYDAEGMPLGLGRLTCLQTLPIFVVGEGKGYSGIQELKWLTELKGDLTIKRLWNVSNAEEAKEAELKNKPKIESLFLQGCALRKANTNHPQDEAVVDEEESRKVLEALQPHANVKYLSIAKYGGNNNPTWLQDTMLPNLESLTLEDWCCASYKSLPPLGQFRMLKSLEIDNMSVGLKHMGPEFYDAVGEVKGNFLLLNRLRISNVPNLEEWCPITDGEFPRLQDLIVSMCPKLMKMPNYFPTLKLLGLNRCSQLTSLPILPSIDELILSDCNVDLLTRISHLTSLTSLHISKFDKLQSLPEDMLQTLGNLRRLRIADCENLVSLQERDDGIPSSSLTSLFIFRCGKLMSLPNLTSLDELCLFYCNAVLLTRISHLTSLSSLYISNFRKLKSLPKEMLLPSLTSLNIDHCQKLMSLPKGLRSLTSLTGLSISYCNQLHSLPEEGLPATVKFLDIFWCPQLAERCQKEVGEDWAKISHIPHLNIL